MPVLRQPRRASRAAAERQPSSSPEPRSVSPVRASRVSIFLPLDAATRSASPTRTPTPARTNAKTPTRVNIAAPLALQTRIQSSFAAFLRELQRPSPSSTDIDTAAQTVLEVSRQINAMEEFPQFISATLAHDSTCHVAFAVILRSGPQRNGLWGVRGNVNASAVSSMLEAYSNFASCVDSYKTLAGFEGFLLGLVEAIRFGALHSAENIESWAVFLLSQLALAGPTVAATIALLPGFTASCLSAMSHGAGVSENLAVYTALLVNNVAALGGEEAIRALTMSGELVRELGSWLDDAHDAGTLQRLTGCFNHLSRSAESAKSLHEHGIMDALRRLSSRPAVAGSSEAREAYVGLANMAMANIAVRQVTCFFLPHKPVAR